MKLRRRAWQDRGLALEPNAWPTFASQALSPGEHLAETELLRALRVAIAERLNTTRGALYKTLHDARRKLRGQLAADGCDIAEASGTTTMTDDRTPPARSRHLGGLDRDRSRSSRRLASWKARAPWSALRDLALVEASSAIGPLPSEPRG